MRKIFLILLVISILIISGCTKDPCKQKVKGKGPCEAFFVGYEYDTSQGKCIEKGVSGCSSETPFDSLEECQSFCENK